MVRDPLLRLPRRARGFAMTDLLAVCVCAGMLVSLLVPLAGSTDDGKGDDQPAPKTWPARNVVLRDATQLKQIHQSFIVFAREFDDVLPLPGNIRRLPIDGRRIPGRGEQDITLNTTANLYSVCIMMNYFNPDLIISPWERNPNVAVHDEFDWAVYDPIQATYWDDSFKADLTKQSHVSYAHLLLTGDRQAQWRTTFLSDYIQLSNRGPDGGVGDAKSFTCDDEGQWRGNVVFADNATLWSTSMTHDDVTFENAEGEPVADNFFKPQSDDDIFMTFTQSINEAGKATVQHD